MTTLPQIAPQGNLILANTTIHTVDGLYSLNDLHRASGGRPKHKPSNFMANQETQALIREIELENTDAGISASAIRIIKGGNNRSKQGTYVCKELVYRYAMWVSPKFSLMVIRTFDKIANNQHYALLDEFNKAVLTLEELETLASNAGRALSVVGKQLKPKAKDKVVTLQAQLQFTLPQGE